MDEQPAFTAGTGWRLTGRPVGEILAYDLVKDPKTALMAPVVAAGIVFLLIPPFLVVYSLVWAWPVAAKGNRFALSALVLFAVVVEATSGWFWIGFHASTLTTVLMRVLAVFSPLAFGTCAVSAAWAYRLRAARGPSAVAGQPSARMEDVESQLARERPMAMLRWRARSA
jgi:hypothetical protein